MAVRRQPTQRLLSGRNAANPIEMASDFNLSSSSPQGVGGVMRAVKPQGGIDDGPLNVLNGLAEWGTKKVREAAKTRYETLAMDGAMAYQQGKSVDELPMDGNKWMLEGYRIMEAETVASALNAAQQEEISLRLHESDPDTFRANYVGRLNAALAGKDERTQEIIKQRMMEQMPSLVAQHTRENARYQEGQNYDALTSSIDVISRDPANSTKLVDFALGGAGSEGLSSERRQSAVIDGVVRAYANDNPLAYSVLEAQGVFDNLTTEEAQKLKAAQGSYENRVRSTYDEARFTEERALMSTIELGELTPEEAVLAWSDFRTRHGLTMDAAEAGAVANAAADSNATHVRAIGLEIETAKINGDFNKVADLSYEYANRAANPSTPGTIYDYTIPVEYQMGPARPNRPSQEITSVIARTAEDVLGTGGKVVITSGTENEGDQYGSNRHKTGNAADVAFYRPDGSRVKATDPEMQEIALRAAELGATGIGFGAEYMGGEHMHIDLVGTKGGGGYVWASGAKALGEDIVARINSNANSPSMGKVDQERWKTLVDYYKGDVELAAVAYSTSTENADKWNGLGRGTDILSDDTAAFVSRLTGSMSGQRYVTAATRMAVAEETYNIAREALAVDVYAQIKPAMAALDAEYVRGSMSEQDYRDQSQALRDQWGVAMTKADVDQMVALGAIKQQKLDTQAQEAQNEDYAQRVGAFSVERTAADNRLTDAIEAITTMDKPEGVSDSAFLASQQEAILAAQTEHQAYIADTASKYGVEWKDSAAVDTAKKGIEQVRSGFERALTNSQEIATMERAVATGTLGSQPTAIQERAYEAALNNIGANTTRFASTPKKDGSMPTQEEAQAFQQGQLEDWFAKTNFVPAEVRNQFSSVLTGQLVTKDGVVSQHALDAITAYMSLKQKSSVAADKLLSPEARLVADAAIATAGSAEALPRVLLDMWAQGLGNPYSGKEPPNFAERGDVQSAIAAAVKSPTLLGSLFGTPTGARSMNLTPEAQELAQTMMTAQVQRLFSLNPNLNPKYTVALAEEALLKSAVPVDESGPGWGGFGGQNRLLIDPTGGNIMEQMFGADAPSYESDRSSVAVAIKDYLASGEFKSRYGDMTPSMGAGEWLYSVLPFTDDTMRKSQKQGVPMFTAQHVGNGKVYFDFTLDGDGTTQSVVIPLEEIGTWYKNTLRDKYTK